MPSFQHKQLIEKIAALDVVPDDDGALDKWVQAEAHLDFLEANAQQDEVIVYAGGPYTYVHSLVIPKSALNPVDVPDLLKWSCDSYGASVASYSWGGGHKHTQIVRGEHIHDSKSLEGGTDLIYIRTFDGWPEADRTYIELSHEYSHVNDIHWREHESAYCRFDVNGDVEHVVSCTPHKKENDVSLASFMWRDLENYLVVTDSVLVRMFSLTLFRRDGSFSEWGMGPEEVKYRGGDFFFKFKKTGLAAYSKGVQIIRPQRSRQEIDQDIQGGRLGHKDKKYVEFTACDWRHRRIIDISTDPAATTNYFEKKEGLPFELSPAFFRPEVLSKYKMDREKYTIGERDITCRASWHLRGYDVNEAAQIHAYICDLRSLPYQEQLHWKSHNVRPAAGISQRAFTTDFQGQFSESSPCEKMLLIIDRWQQNKVGWWKLRDIKLKDHVSPPVTSSKNEWSMAIMDIAKLVIEGFEQKFIRKELDKINSPYKTEDRSIALLEKLIDQKNLFEDEAHLEALRSAQRIRSVVAGHAGGSEGQKLAKDAKEKHGDYKSHFEHLCNEITKELELVEKAFNAENAA